MSSIRHRDRAEAHRSHADRRRAPHHIRVWLLAPFLLAAVVIAAVIAALWVRAQGSAVASKPSSDQVHVHTALMQPADRFIQSVVTEDGALGWHQLCPEIQAQVPIDALVQEANAQRTAEAHYGIWLTMAPVGTYAQRGGGALHVYRLTAHWPNGATQQRTFMVLTQPSGCVEDVQNQ